jgi:hypothetical protein
MTHSCHVYRSDDLSDKKTRSPTVVSLHAHPDEASDKKIAA